MSQFIRGNQDEIVNEWDSKAASLMLKSTERRKRMVEDLLDLTRTRLGSGIPIAPKPMDLKTLCQDVLAELEAFHPDRHLELHSEGDLRGTWDLDRLAQVLSNLLGNTLQHGERDSPITLLAKVDGEEVVIEVHNKGRPIPRAMLGNIFEPMVRNVEGNEEGKVTSIGLGLHIAREIVLAHRGTLVVKSPDRAGTTFTVRLPCRFATASFSQVPGKLEAKGEIVAPDQPLDGPP